MLEKQVSIDKIEVLEHGAIQVREATRIVEDGTVLSTTYNRWVLVPGADLTGQDAKIVVIAEAIWTPEVISKYNESIQNRLP